MGNIYFTSDLHLYHDRAFVYEPRGFNNIYDMNDAIVKNWNSIVTEEDEVYILGDLMLNDNDNAIKLVKQLNGKIHIILGNHDTVTRTNLYRECHNVIDVSYATVIKYKGYHFYLSHYPTMTGNLEKESLKQCMCCLFGHTHSKDKFYNDIPFMYNVAADAHNCTPVNIDTIIEDMKAKVEECKKML